MQLICYLQIVHFDVAIFFMHITNDFNDIIYKLIQKSHISHKQIGDLVETLWKHLKKLLVGKYTYKCQKYTIAGMVNDGRVPTRVSITGCFFFFIVKLNMEDIASPYYITIYFIYRKYFYNFFCMKVLFYYFLLR